MRSALICLLLLVTLPAAAQIYKYTDANGNTAYSNQPPDGRPSQSIELPPLNSVESVRKPAPTTLPATTVQVPQTTYQTLALTGLPTEEALRANNGTFDVGVAIQPRLRPGDTLRLVLDGQPYGQPANVPRLQLVNVDRGEHSLAVEVLDSQQTVLQQSATVTFTVQRVHLP
jgi:hypothetical protein